jgi:hypothetical protein
MGTRLQAIPVANKGHAQQKRLSWFCFFACWWLNNVFRVLYLAVTHVLAYKLLLMHIANGRTVLFLLGPSLGFLVLVSFSENMLLQELCDGTLRESRIRLLAWKSLFTYYRLVGGVILMVYAVCLSTLLLFGCGFVYVMAVVGCLRTLRILALRTVNFVHVNRKIEVEFSIGISGAWRYDHNCAYWVH